MERKANADGSSSDSSGTEFGANADIDPDDLDTKELANQHWASGAAGIAAYREAMRQKRMKKRAKMEVESEGENKGESEDDEERGNLRFDQPIKERRLAKRKANAVAAKIGKKKQNSRAL